MKPSDSEECPFGDAPPEPSIEGSLSQLWGALPDGAPSYLLKVVAFTSHLAKVRNLKHVVMYGVPSLLTQLSEEVKAYAEGSHLPDPFYITSLMSVDFLWQENLQPSTTVVAVADGALLLVADVATERVLDVSKDAFFCNPTCKTFH